MIHFSNRKYVGHIAPLYRQELIQLHLNLVKKHLGQPAPVTPWIGNSHLKVIALLTDTSLEWKVYFFWCKYHEIESFKPIIKT